MIMAEKILTRVLEYFFLLFLFQTETLVKSGNSPDKAETCSVLYSMVNQRGSNFTLGNYDDALDLPGDFRSSPNGWESTESFTVKKSCQLQICNGTYLTGECRSFREGQYSSVEYKDTVSASCECHRECKCGDVKMKMSSCAYAYLNEGCNSCTAKYADFFGEEPEVADQFSDSIKAFKIRRGCTLKVYDDIEYEGEERVFTGAGDIVEDFTGAVLSYSCQCLVLPAVTERSSRRPSNYPPMISIPPSLDEVIAMLRGNHKNHKGLVASFKSLNSNPERRRSSKNAYILVLGSTGSGKSSTINVLFDNPNITKVGGTMSTTTNIHEFRISVPVDELGISNSELRVIDTPGFGDTRGLEQDAKFLATLDNFLAGHEELQDRIPNIVLIMHKLTDNRYSGIGSQFVQMLAGFDSFRNRITDDTFSNVIFVFSHFCSEMKATQRKPDKLADFKSVIENYSQFPRPLILTVAENKGKDCDLPMINGYYQLPNKDYYPKNLFDKMNMITSNTGDEIGRAVFRTAFRNSDNFQVTGNNYPLITADSKISKYYNILSRIVLNITTAEVPTLLAQSFSRMETQLKSEFPHSLHYLQKAVNIQGINKLGDVPKTTASILELLSTLEKNPATMYLLQNGLNIRLPTFPSGTVAGDGYNVFRDEKLSSSPFDLSSINLQPSDIGYLLPDRVSCVKQVFTEDIFNVLEDKVKYLERRLGDLGVAGLVHLDSFKGILKPGYNILQTGSAPFSYSATREVRLFKLELEEKPKVAQKFEQAIQKLSPFDSFNHVSVHQWNGFFTEYGTHVVKSLYGGGSIKIQITSPHQLSEDVGKVLFNKVGLGDVASLLVTESNSNPSLDGITYSLTFSGGDPKYHTNDLTKLSLERAATMLSNWKKSLLFSPILLSTHLEVMPISEIVKRVSVQMSSEVEKAQNLLFNASLVYSPPLPKESNLVSRLNLPVLEDRVLSPREEQRAKRNLRIVEQENGHLVREEVRRKRVIEHAEKVYERKRGNLDKILERQIDAVDKRNKRTGRNFDHLKVNHVQTHSRQTERLRDNHVKNIENINNTSKRIVDNVLKRLQRRLGIQG